jgi:hypothetical protein
MFKTRAFLTIAMAIALLPLIASAVCADGDKKATTSDSKTDGQMTAPARVSADGNGPWPLLRTSSRF